MNVVSIFSRRGSAAHTTKPEIHIDVSSGFPVLTWDTHGLPDCVLHWSGSDAGCDSAVSIADLENDFDQGVEVGAGKHAHQRWWITGPGRICSNIVHLYGPRCPLTDLRTQISSLNAQY
ncbi:MAG: hypothetical protein QM658_13315 [Gordonia sp. (in: high G+C Gram-positive bacteria)]